jgi:excisionase family DNA binding protein
MILLNNKQLFRPDEIVQILGLSRRTVYRMIQDGRLADVDLSKKPVRIPRASIIALAPGIDEL